MWLELLVELVIDLCMVTTSVLETVTLESYLQGNLYCQYPLGSHLLERDSNGCILFILLF